MVSDGQISRQDLTLRLTALEAQQSRFFHVKSPEWSTKSPLRFKKKKKLTKSPLALNAVSMFPPCEQYWPEGVFPSS